GEGVPGASEPQQGQGARRGRGGWVLDGGLMGTRPLMSRAEEADGTGGPASSGSAKSWSAARDAAFSAFYREFVPTLVASLTWHGARLADAADAAQDTMSKAYLV